MTHSPAAKTELSKWMCLAYSWTTALIEVKDSPKPARRGEPR